MRTNAYPGQCKSCRAPIGASAGFIFRDAAGWQTVCKSRACHQALGLETASGVRRLHADGSVEMPYDAAALPLLRAMPGARWDRGRARWTVSLDVADRPRLLELAEKLELDVDPELREIETSPEERAAVERGKAAGLYPFQLEGVAFLARHERALLGDDMGLGKTPQTLVALPGPAIVVCPNAMKFVWEGEARKWRPDLRVTVLPRGSKNFRLPARGEIVVTNYEGLPAWLQPKATGKLDERGRPIKQADIPDAIVHALKSVTLVVDEAHAAKNYKAQRSQKITLLGKLCARCWFLTGTPLMNRPLDLFGVLSSGGMERDVFGSWSRFVKCFNGYKNRWDGWQWGDPEPEVPERLRRVMLRRTKAEVLPELPRKRYQTITVECGDDAAELLDMYRDELDERFELGMLPDFTDFSRVRAMLAADRVEPMLELVAEHEEQNEPLLVFSAHRAPVDALEKRDGWAVITGDTKPETRADIVRRFQAGELKGVGLTIAAGGVGLTLTRASRVLFVDHDWTPAMNWQAEDRVCRIGQTASSVLIMRMVSTHPLDRRVHDLLEQKIRLIEQTIERTVNYDAERTELVEESEESMLARRAELEAKLAEVAREAERQEAKERVARFYEKRCAGAAVKAPITPERAAAIRRGIELMAERCDYAQTEDGAGFNKPDAAIGHWLACAGLDDEKSLRLAETILRGYPRQMQELGVKL